MGNFKISPQGTSEGSELSLSARLESLEREGDGMTTGSIDSRSSVRTKSAGLLSAAKQNSDDSTHMQGRLNNSKTDVIIKLETLPDDRVKTIFAVLYSAIIVCAFAVGCLFALKLRSGDKYWKGQSLLVWNTTVASVNVALCGFCVLFMAHRRWRVYKFKKRWSERRRKGQILTTIEICTQFVNSVFYLVPNAYILVNECGWFDSIVHWSGYIRFTCWNTLFVLWLIYGNITNPFLDKEGNPVGRFDALIMDAPWSHHKKKLIIWFTYQAVLTSIIVQADVNSRRDLASRDVPPCTGLDFDCALGDSVVYLTCIIAAFCILYLVLYFNYLRKTKAYLKDKPYFFFRMGNIVFRLQMHLRMVIFAFIVLSMALLWFTNMWSCASYALSWLGFLPMQLTTTIMTVIVCGLFHPIDPTEEVTLSLWLQEFSWREEDLPKNKKERGGGVCHMHHPMFCFETAFKMYYWTELIYDYKEIDNSRFSLDVAMKLYNLNNYELFLEPLHDTKVLIAWGKDAVVLAFRGTKTMKNVIADLRMFRKVHPPKRGSWWNTPKVHRGFLETWQSNGLDKRIIDKVKSIIQREGSDEWHPYHVYVTGHSLGGALATLAAYDLRKHAGLPPCAIQCYTFGAPRTGNHAFAADYNETVPDTWHIINDQDYITRTLKFIRMYKRHGERVIINSHGDMIVKPSFIEINVLRRWGEVNVLHHLLGKYRQSLQAIVEEQFKGGKHMEGGFRAMLELFDHKKVVSGDKPHITQVLGLERATLLRLREFGDRLKVLADRKKKEERQARLEKVASAFRKGSIAVGMGVRNALDKLSSMNSSDGEAEEVVESGTLACGRKMCRDLTKCSDITQCAKDPSRLCMETGHFCPVVKKALVDWSTSALGQVPEDMSHSVHPHDLHEITIDPSDRGTTEKKS